MKKKIMEQAPKKLSFEEAIKQVNEVDIKSAMLQTKIKFPDSPEVWLKNLVTHLNSELEHRPETDNYLGREHTDYPASCLKKGCIKVLNSAIADCSKTILDDVLWFCVHSMLDGHQKGTAAHGFRIFLQILIRGHPDIVLSKLSQCKDLVKINQNRASSCLMLMWALGQVGYPNFRAGIRVWLDIMQPCLGMKALWSYCLQYLQTLLSLHHKDLYQAAGEIQLREYFYLLDTIYGHVLPSDLRKQLKVLHPQLKMIAQGKDLSNNLRNFFPSYLIRAKPDTEKELRGEVLSFLVECLSKDKFTYSQWIQLYSKHLLQTRVFLEHISDNFETLRGRLDLKLLHETLKTFVRTNEESATGRNAADMEAVTALCEDISKKMTKPRFPWRWFILFLISMVVFFVAYIFSCKNEEVILVTDVAKETTEQTRFMWKCSHCVKQHRGLQFECQKCLKQFSRGDGHRDCPAASADHIHVDSIELSVQDYGDSTFFQKWDSYISVFVFVIYIYLQNLTELYHLKN